MVCIYIDMSGVIAAGGSGHGRSRRGDRAPGSLPLTLFYILFSALVTFSMLIINKRFIMPRLHHVDHPSELDNSGVMVKPLPPMSRKKTVEAPVVSSLQNSRTDSLSKPSDTMSTGQAFQSIPNSTVKARVSMSDAPAPDCIRINDQKGILSTSLQCPSSESHKFSSSLGTSDGETAERKKWCFGMQSKHKVSVGRSWGSLSKDAKFTWDKKRCNELITGNESMLR